MPQAIYNYLCINASLLSTCIKPVGFIKGHQSVKIRFDAIDIYRLAATCENNVHQACGQKSRQSTCIKPVDNLQQAFYHRCERILTLA